MPPAFAQRPPLPPTTAIGSTAAIANARRFLPHRPFLPLCRRFRRRVRGDLDANPPVSSTTALDVEGCTWA